jgi:phosphoglycerate dehydrogenase-like enzyme
MPRRAGYEAVGTLPEDVQLSVVPPVGELPRAMLEAEFLIPLSGDPRLGEMLPQMEALRVVQTLSAGVDWLPPLPPGVKLCDASGTRDIAVAEWVMAAILASTKTLGELRDSQRKQRWEWRQTGELAGATVLILGYGSIGRAVERRLAPFEVELIRVARNARAGVHSADDLCSLLPKAEVVIVLLALTPETTGLLDANMLAALQPGALLVNAARGAIVDTPALLELLRAGRVRAALDVTDPEPLPPDHPLWGAPGVLITPHLAGDTIAADRRAFALIGEQVRRYLRREPLVNIVSEGY